MRNARARTPHRCAIVAPSQARKRPRSTAAVISLPLIGLLLLALIVWIWRDAMRARETANRVCATACAELGVQLLDETVALHRIRIRSERGRGLRLQRIYEFEYSGTGMDRRRGTIVLAGTEIELFHIEGPDQGG